MPARPLHAEGRHAAAEQTTLFKKGAQMRGGTTKNTVHEIHQQGGVQFKDDAAVPFLEGAEQARNANNRKDSSTVSVG